jgi:hypothetical protein
MLLHKDRYSTTGVPTRKLGVVVHDSESGDGSGPVLIELLKRPGDRKLPWHQPGPLLRLRLRGGHRRQRRLHRDRRRHRRAVSRAAAQQELVVDLHAGARVADHRGMARPAVVQPHPRRREVHRRQVPHRRVSALQGRCTRAPGRRRRVLRARRRLERVGPDRPHRPRPQLPVARARRRDREAHRPTPPAPTTRHPRHGGPRARHRRHQGPAHGSGIRQPAVRLGRHLDPPHRQRGRVRQLYQPNRPEYRLFELHPKWNTLAVPYLLTIEQIRGYVGGEKISL